jgi:glycosyltransferase involved in cell wall biosynthesis
MSTIPVGGYKVVYEYANQLSERGVNVEVWHSRAFFAETRHGWKRWLALGKSWARALARRVLRNSPTVSWFSLDSRVGSFETAGLPTPRIASGDVVVATAIETTEYGASLARRAGARSVALIQHFEEWAASEAFIKEAWGAVDARVVIAPWLAEKCAEAGLDSVLIPNALEHSRFPEGPPLSARIPQVMSLLAPHSYKRPDVVIAVMEEVNRRRPDARLVAFGQGPRLSALPDFVQYHQNPSHEVLTSLYQATRVYLCGSDAEGWHLPPAEASLCGATVVSTDIGGVRVSMEDDALYAPPGDIEALTGAVLLALDDPGAQDRVERCRRRLLARSYSRNTDELLTVLWPQS